jgi:predicted ester cyclase
MSKDTNVTAQQVFDAAGIPMSRFDGGKIVQRWGSTDQLTMMTQLGLSAP